MSINILEQIQILFIYNFLQFSINFSSIIEDTDSLNNITTIQYLTE